MYKCFSRAALLYTLLNIFPPIFGSKSRLWPQAVRPPPALAVTYCLRHQLSRVLRDPDRRLLSLDRSESRHRMSARRQGPYIYIADDYIIRCRILTLIVLSLTCRFSDGPTRSNSVLPPRSRLLDRFASAAVIPPYRDAAAVLSGY